MYSISIAMSQAFARNFLGNPIYGIWFALLALSVFSSFATAQQADGLSIKIGETDLYPAVRVDFLQRSNAFLTESDPEEISAFTIKPEAYWIAERRLLSLQASYNGAYQFASESFQNYNDHILGASVNAELSTRKRVNANLSIEFGHEDLGTNLTAGTVTPDSEQIKYVDTRARTSFTYGAARARGNIVVGLNVGQFSYSNRSDVTAGRDYNFFQPFGKFSLRISGDTRATIELRYRSFDSSPARDRTDLSILAGLQFAATGKSGGSFALGTATSSFKDAGVDDRSNFIVEGNLFWEPSVFSRLDLELLRNLDGVDGGLASTNSPTVIRDRAELQWKYAWSDRLRHTAKLGITAVDADCPSRDRLTSLAGLEVDLKVRRWLSVGISGSTESREFSDCAVEPDVDPMLDYTNNTVGLYLRATL